MTTPAARRLSWTGRRDPAHSTAPGKARCQQAKISSGWPLSVDITGRSPPPLPALSRLRESAPAISENSSQLGHIGRPADLLGPADLSSGLNLSTGQLRIDDSPAAGESQTHEMGTPSINRGYRCFVPAGVGRIEQFTARLTAVRPRIDTRQSRRRSQEGAAERG
jgi:hypothetical protein